MDSGIGVAFQRIGFVDNGRGEEAVMVNGESAGWSCQGHEPVIPCYSTKGEPGFVAALVYRFSPIFGRQRSISIGGSKPREDQWLSVGGDVHIRFGHNGVTLVNEISEPDSGEEWKADQEPEEIFFHWPGDVILE